MHIGAFDISLGSSQNKQHFDSKMACLEETENDYCYDKFISINIEAYYIGIHGNCGIIIQVTMAAGSV